MVMSSQGRYLDGVWYRCEILEVLGSSLEDN